MSVLTAIDLAKGFRHRQVVQGISLAVESGEVVGLLGPNGAGKTTSFYMLVGLIPADSGQVILDGQDITGLPMHQRARRGVGYLPQESSVFRKLSVQDNLRAVLEIGGQLKRDAIEERCLALLEEFGIAHLRENSANSLSGGERRRLEIARSLALRPRFMLLDEPFAGIDPIAVSEIKKIVTHLRDRKIGVLITDHNVRETLDICDRAYIISNGQAIAHGTPGELLRNPQVRIVYLGENFSM